MHTLKKNRITRFAVLLLVLTLMTSCFVGGTFAKYTSTATTEAVATVAKWAIEVNDDNITVGTPVVDFNLFDAVYDLDASGKVTATADTDVLGSNKLVAPGTGGSYALKVENLSQVNAAYAIDFTLSNAGNIPLKFSLDNSTWTSDISTLDVTKTNIAMTDGTSTVTLYWKWDFGTADFGVVGAQDTADTLLGVTPVSATVTAKITVEQVD